MKTVLVLGMRASGISASALLKKRGVRVRCYDDNLSIPDNWKGRGDAIFDGLDAICVSPGVPNTHPILIEAKNRGIEVFSELDLGVAALNCQIIMITGTNGKTTTVDMVERGLNLAGMRAKATGNAGYPASQVVLDDRKWDWAVVEASSFQLEYTSNIQAHIAVVLNLAPDHIDRYSEFSEYIEAKKRVFMNQTEDDYAILNYDSKQVRELAKDLKSKVIFVSATNVIGDFYIKDDYYVYKGEPLISVKDSRIKGEHNKFNMLVALNILAIAGASKDKFSALIRDYKSLPHRIEYVSTIEGKRFYNDSKGTNIAACKAAINVMLGSNIGLILGGSDKREDFCDFFDELNVDVKYVAVTGANESKIYGSALKVGFQNISIYDSLYDAVKALYDMPNIDTILFSPACASFDRYSSYAERGDRFKQIVYGFKT
ncbi:MAG: UDP-N-acetylmuramoyl-L-alanine--D-glutamate ligase [Christensenellaceae bacterium]|nr:UDP-N-acetylmuramoyl-L-alanine--D-glutamate ligase [Christensenellaceae bacterium]